MKKEIEVILLATLQKRTEDEDTKLLNLVQEELDWGFIAGVLTHHRLSGYFINGITDEMKKYLLPEFARTLELIFKAQTILNKERYDEIQKVFDEFDKNDVHYAGLKGLIYGVDLYPYGARRSNDCDVLVLESDLSKIDAILRNFGYIQSSDRGQTEATKRAKLIQRMNYHDLVPYFKSIDSELQDKIKIDINFHLDNKDNDITKEVLDYGTQLYCRDSYKIKGLNYKTHFLHLCIHFAREASNSLWVAKKRDILLYKVVDVMNTFRNMSKEDLYECIELSERFNVYKQYYYMLYYLDMYYDDSLVKELLTQFHFDDTSFLNQIKIEGENRIVYREESFFEQSFNLKYSKKFVK